jgi:hypothetical protein
VVDTTPHPAQHGLLLAEGNRKLPPLALLYGSNQDFCDQIRNLLWQVFCRKLGWITAFTEI